MSRFTYDGHKFYHGTSTIFLDSIRATGLGAVNPSFDLKLLDVVKYLYKKAKLAGVQDLQLFTWENSIKATIAQADLVINGQTFNFRHKSMYVSASHVRAAMYAGLNKYGSEMLEKSIGLLEILARHNVDVKIPKDIDVFGVQKYLNAKPTPIIVEVLEIADEDLEKEDGSSAPDTLHYLRTILPTVSEKVKFEYLQYCNFKILKAVPPQKLRFYEMEFEGHPKYGNFEFTLSKI